MTHIKDTKEVNKQETIHFIIVQNNLQPVHMNHYL